MSSKKNIRLTSSKADSAPDPEMLENLDLLLDYQVIEDEKDWETVDKMDESSDEPNQEAAP